MIPEWLKKRPWMWIVFAFIVLIAIWTKFIMLAVNNQPEKILPDEKKPGKIEKVEKSEKGDLDGER